MTENSKWPFLLLKSKLTAVRNCGFWPLPRLWEVIRACWGAVLTYAETTAGAHGPPRFSPGFSHGGDTDWATETRPVLLSTDILHGIHRDPRETSWETERNGKPHPHHQTDRHTQYEQDERPCVKSTRSIAGLWAEVSYHGKILKDLDAIPRPHVRHMVKVGGVWNQLIPLLRVSQHLSEDTQEKLHIS